jgi:hypothetical protein
MGKNGENGDTSLGDGSGGQGPQGGIGNGGQAEYGEHDTGFDPDSVKGKIDPKGRIGVTTFRGLPKPGELTTEMRVAVEEARAEAQAPLEQDQIPRRYRDGIRDYFQGLDEKK